MVRLYTYALLLISALAAYNHYNHLDLDYTATETRRLTYLSEEDIYAKIENNRVTIKLLADRFIVMQQKMTEEEAAVKWKADFEEKYADDFDRALIV